MRLSAVYALSDPDNQHGMIAADHLKAALAVWDYCEASCRFIFGDKLGDETADAILSALRATPDGMTRTDVSNLLGRHHTSADIQRALSMLSLRALALKTVEPTTGGRPAERWRAAR